MLQAITQPRIHTTDTYFSHGSTFQRRRTIPRKRTIAVQAKPIRECKGQIAKSPIKGPEKSTAYTSSTPHQYAVTNLKSVSIRKDMRSIGGKTFPVKAALSVTSLFLFASITPSMAQDTKLSRSQPKALKHPQ